MATSFVAETSVVIDAPAADVWEALTNPELVRAYLHGTTMATDWQVGSPITWTGEWKGQAYQDKGTVLEVEAGKRLTTTHWSPLGGSEDKPENYHTVSYELAENGGRQTTLTLKQDNNPSQEAADAMAQNNWLPILEKLKEVVEK
ncbi:MAG: SRPBCC domain-containing protein [Candidatus Dormiibacterota bacterium]